jgi:hypothetical protein
METEGNSPLEDDGRVYIRVDHFECQLLSKYIVGLDMHFGTLTGLLPARPRCSNAYTGIKSHITSK